MDRLDEAGGVAVLALLTDGVLRIASLTPAEAATTEDDQVTPVHQDSRVDMFFDYLGELDIGGAWQNGRS